MKYLANKKKERIQQGDKSIKKVILIVAVSIFAIISVVVAIILLKPKATNKNIKLLKQLTENNKSLKNFQVTLQTKNELVFDENTTSVETSGILSNRNNFEKAMYKIHTTGKSTFKTEENFDVTGTFFCLENNVYESVGTSVAASSLTYEDFSKMCKEITLFKIVDENVKNEKVSNHEDGAMSLQFDLKSIDKSILSAHLEQYQKTSETKINADDVEFISASVTYLVRDEIIMSQELKIQTALKNAESTSFGFVSRINYIDINKDFNFETPTIPSGTK